jgi:hypothetical protein
MNVGDFSKVSNIHVLFNFSVDPEDRVSIYLPDVGKISHIQKWYQPNNTININSKLPWKRRINNNIFF